MGDDRLPADDSAVAVVGMSCRFAGANTPDELWHRVLAGDDCLVDVDPDASHIGTPGTAHVPRAGVLDDVDMFDPGFFGLSPRDASITDPQHRLFLECAWEALESAALVPERADGPIAVFAGAGANTYLINNLFTNPDLVDELGWFQLRHTGNDKDFLATSVAYRLDLRGPALSVQTACSTSLVAVHLAVQSLLSFECDTALAGGTTVEFPHGSGYTYREGEILSADGVCRAFDEASTGTVLSSGVGAVALRRLGDALADGDPVLAVIRGSAVNNDGAGKVSYLAPSVDGHADVVREALAVAGVDARSIGMIEAHGTGTSVGDPIEVAALSAAFRSTTPDIGFCRLGSIKPNIGHTDTAAGVASLIKAIQSLRHRTLPPLANHTAPNPIMDLGSTPFVISETPASWPAGAEPRRVGVSSLGVGGTNAHVIVEEAPDDVDARDDLSPGRAELLVVSANSVKALSGNSAAIADHVIDKGVGDAPFVADAARTLAFGRRHMPFRRSIVARDLDGAAQRLRMPVNAAESVDDASAVFVFPGGGAQHVGMTNGLDDRFEVFHDVVARGAERWSESVGRDVRLDLDDSAALERPSIGLPWVFVTSVAVAEQWRALGVLPSVLMGHSLGEYAAACVAGIFDFTDALDLVIRRSELMEAASEGVEMEMMVVPLPESDTRPLLVDTAEIVAINAIDECVIAGPVAAVSATARRVPSELEIIRIPLAAAPHHRVLDAVLGEYSAAVASVTKRAPKIPIISNLTGRELTAEQATSVDYWVDHFRQPVRFADGLASVLALHPTVMIETGPGHALSAYFRRSEGSVTVVPSLAHPKSSTENVDAFLGAAGVVWSAGMPVNLGNIVDRGRRRPFPTYAFDRQKCFVPPGPLASPLSPSARPSTAVVSVGDAEAPSERTGTEVVTRIDDLDHACWVPKWKLADATTVVDWSQRRRWTIVADDGDPDALEARDALVGKGHDVQIAEASDLASAEADLAAADVVIVFDPLTAPAADDAPIPGDLTTFERSRERWLVQALRVARALGAGTGSRMVGVTRGAFAAAGTPADCPSAALARGVLAVAPKEYPELCCIHLDLPGYGDSPVSALTWIDDALGSADAIVRRSQDLRSVPSLERRTPEPAADPVLFRRRGVYVLTGGLGGVGYELARSLVVDYDARLALVTTDDLPTGDDAVRWLATHAPDDPRSQRLRRLRDLVDLGGDVVAFRADMSRAADVPILLDNVEKEFGSLDGAIHAAGRLDDALIEFIDDENVSGVIGAKAKGAVLLVNEMVRRAAELVVLISSSSTVLAPVGQTAYVAANSVLDALAGRHGDTRVATIQFGVWSGTGVAARLAERTLLGVGAGEPFAHPVLSQRIEHGDGTVTLLGRLDNEHHWITDEHRTLTGVAVLPGTAHLELMLTAGSVMNDDDSLIELTDVSIALPLTVPDSASTWIRVVVIDHSIRLESFDHELEQWVLHSDAMLGTAGDAEPAESWMALANEAFDSGADVDPLTRPSGALQLGRRWDVVDRAVVGARVAAAELRLPADAVVDADVWIAHPALLDVATAVAAALADGVDGGMLLVPVAYAEVRRWGSISSPTTTVARRSSATPARAGAEVFDLACLDADGRCVVEIRGLSMLVIDPQGLTSRGPLPTEQPRDVVTPVDKPNLIGLSRHVGLRSADGMALIERLLVSDDSAMVASTIDVDVLCRNIDRATANERSDTEGADASELPTEEALSAIWSDLLGLDYVDADADFFDLGGHSLLAIRLLARVHREFGVRLALSSVFEAATVRKLSDLVGKSLTVASAGPAMASTHVPEPLSEGSLETAGSRFQSVVEISMTGPGQPLYVVHGAGGNVLFFGGLGRALREQRPLHGFQAIGSDGRETPDPSIAAMAARYVEDLVDHSEPPYLLAGFSGGGLVALEMAKRLIRSGRAVDRVILFDSVPPRCGDLPKWQSRKNLIANVLRSGPRAVVPAVRASTRWRRKGRDREFVPPAFFQTELESVGSDVVDLYDHFSTVALCHDLGSYPVDALLVSADEVWPYRPADYGWGDFVTGQIEVAHVAGDHLTMFGPNSVQGIADLITQHVPH